MPEEVKDVGHLRVTGRSTGNKGNNRQSILFKRGREKKNERDLSPGKTEDTNPSRKTRNYERPTGIVPLFTSGGSVRREGKTAGGVQPCEKGSPRGKKTYCEKHVILKEGVLSGRNKSREEALRKNELRSEM